MLQLDTHALIWLDEDSGRLGQHSLDLINTAFQAGKLAVSAITFWEIAMLVARQRITIQIEIAAWRKQLLENGLLEICLDGSIGVKAGNLKNFHGNPADRMIVATALLNSATLVTADQKILNWKNRLRTIDARI